MEETAGKTASTPPDRDLPKVLVIDDSAGARELIGYMLAREGYEVLEADSGPRGLAMARRHRPVAIILDVIMPEMDGWSVLEYLKTDPELSAIPVIMATVLDDASKGYVFGATDYLTKPLDRRVLVDLVAKHARDRTAGPILVIEDDAGTREITVWMLEREGWRVTEAASARRGLDQVSRERPQLILLDLIMPEMDGFQFIDELYRTPAWRDIPIVVVTAMDITEEQTQYLERRVSRILHKGDHSREDLLGTVATLLRTSREQP